VGAGLKRQARKEGVTVREKRRKGGERARCGREREVSRVKKKRSNPGRDTLETYPLPAKKKKNPALHHPTFKKSRPPVGSNPLRSSYRCAPTETHRREQCHQVFHVGVRNHLTRRSSPNAPIQSPNFAATPKGPPTPLSIPDRVASNKFADSCRQRT